MFATCQALLLLIVTVYSAPLNLFNLELNDAWNIYKDRFNKSYEDGGEELTRRQVWEESLRYVQRHNLQYDLGKETYTMGINHFSDLTFDEFRDKYLPNKFPIKKNENSQYYMPPLNADDKEDSIDWRLRGFVTGVKNQGSCGSCWAFSSTGSLEGQHFRKYNQLISLSEQQLMDCSQPYGNYGCNGGLMKNAFMYIKDAGGIESEAAYPYKAKQFPCQFNRSNVVATDTGFVSIPVSEALLANAVRHIGPISIAIDAGHPSFQHYKNGIYNEPSCSSTSLDHGVLVVGYGSDDPSHRYWIVKNSWGPLWGDVGYIYMAKDQNNQCGVASMAGYPSV